MCISMMTITRNLFAVHSSKNVGMRSLRLIILYLKDMNEEDNP